MTMIAIATEDELSEQVAIRLTSEVGLHVVMTLRKNGNGYLRSSIGKFAAMSALHPVLVITDLDSQHSPQRLFSDWMNCKATPSGLLFHVAVREVEAWLLADHAGMRKLLGRSAGKLSNSPETLPDPKASLLTLAGKATRDIRMDLVGDRNGMAAQGLGYNARLGAFVRTVWQPDKAAERAPSLAALRSDLSQLMIKN